MPAAPAGTELSLRAARARRVSPRRVLILLHASLTVVLLLAALAASQADRHWTLALAAHFPVQSCALAFVLLLLWPLLRPRRAWVALALIVVLAWDAAALGSWCASAFTAVPPRATGPPLRVLAFNTRPHNRRVDDVLDHVAAQRPDIAVLFDRVASLADAAHALDDRYAVTVVGEFIVCIAADVDAQVAPSVRPRYAVVLDVLHAGRPLRLVVAHPPPAVGDAWAADAVATYAALEQLCVASDVPVAIVGDLNDTPWSPRFRAFVARTGLVDSEAGRGWQPSFPAWPPVMGMLFGIPIDHALLSPEFVCTRRELGPALGSNHRPLCVELAWPAD